MNLFLRIFFLLGCGWWLGNLGAYWLGYYEPSVTEESFAMLFTAMLYMLLSLVSAKRDKEEKTLKRERLCVIDQLRKSGVHTNSDGVSIEKLEYHELKFLLVVRRGMVQ